MSVTAGQIVGAIEGLNQLGVDTSAADSLNLNSLPADLVVGEDVLSVVGIFIPPVAVAATLLAVAIALEPLVAANVKPDPLPMTDAQTTQSRGGRTA